MVTVCAQESGVRGRAASILVLTLHISLLSQSFFGFPSFLLAESEEAPEFPPISNRPVYRGCVWMVEILEYTGCFNWSIKLYDGARRLAAGGCWWLEECDDSYKYPLLYSGRPSQRGKHTIKFLQTCVIFYFHSRPELVFGSIESDFSLPNTGLGSIKLIRFSSRGFIYFVSKCLYPPSTKLDWTGQSGLDMEDLIA